MAAGWIAPDKALRIRVCTKWVKLKAFKNAAMISCQYFAAQEDCYGYVFSYYQCIFATDLTDTLAPPVII